MSVIDRLGDVVHRNLIFVIALSVIPLKFMMFRFCRDAEAETESMLSMPEDLSYISAGLILSSLTVQGPLQFYFRASTHPGTDIVLLLLINFIVILLVHKIAQSKTRIQYMSWRAAVKVRTDAGDTQLNLPLEPDDKNVLHIYMQSLSSLLFSIGCQFLIVCVWLYYVASIFAQV